MEAVKCHPGPADACDKQAQAAIDQASIAGFRIEGWSCVDLTRVVLNPAEGEEDLREVISICCAIVKGRRDAGWASDLSISRDTLDQAIRQVLGGRSVYVRVGSSVRGAAR